jgi:hypothetical protein
MFSLKRRKTKEKQNVRPISEAMEGRRNTAFRGAQKNHHLIRWLPRSSLLSW